MAEVLIKPETTNSPVKLEINNATVKSEDTKDKGSTSMIKLKLDSGEIIEAPVDGVKQWKTISELLEIMPDATEIPLVGEKSPPQVIQLMIDFSKLMIRHGNTSNVKREDSDSKDKKSSDDDTMATWQREFCEKMDLDTLFLVIIAANSVEYKELLDVTTQMVADMIKDATTQQIKDCFEVIDPLKPEEEEALRKELLKELSKEK